MTWTNGYELRHRERLAANLPTPTVSSLTLPELRAILAKTGDVVPIDPFSRGWWCCCHWIKEMLREGHKEREQEMKSWRLT